MSGIKESYGPAKIGDDFPLGDIGVQDGDQGLHLEDQVIWFQYSANPLSYCVAVKTTETLWMPCTEAPDGSLELSLGMLTPTFYVTTEASADAHAEMLTSTWYPPPRSGGDRCKSAMVGAARELGDDWLLPYYDGTTWSVIALSRTSGNPRVISGGLDSQAVADEVAQRIMDTGSIGVFLKGHGSELDPIVDLNCMPWTPHGIKSGGFTPEKPKTRDRFHSRTRGDGSVAGGAYSLDVCFVALLSALQAVDAAGNAALATCRSSLHIHSMVEMTGIVTCCGVA